MSTLVVTHSEYKALAHSVTTKKRPLNNAMSIIPTDIPITVGPLSPEETPILHQRQAINVYVRLITTTSYKKRRLYSI